jgi:hypothetical protein
MQMMIKNIFFMLLIPLVIVSAEYVMKRDGTLIRHVSHDSGVRVPAPAKDDTSIQIVKNAVSVKAFGAKGDGVTDDTLAIQKAIDSESTLYFPKGRYKVTNSIYPRSNTVLISQDATIYYTKEHGVNILYPAFYFEKDLHNIDMLGHWIFEGDTPHSAFSKATATPDDTYVQGIKIKENCSNIYIENFEGYHFSGGALEIGTDDPATIPPGNITIDKMKVYDCWNVNMSITSGRDIHIKNIETYGALSNPTFAQVGVDIEVNTPHDVLENIQIDKIVTHNNETGFQILTMTQAQKGITINEIESYENSDNGISLYNVTDFKVMQLNSHNNKGAGVYIDGTFKNVFLENGSIYNNQNHGVLAQMSASKIPVSSENLHIGLNIYNNHGYGILLAGTEQYPVQKYMCSGKVYDDQSIKTQTTGIDVQKNVLDINITADVFGNKYFQIIK